MIILIILEIVRFVLIRGFIFILIFFLFFFIHGAIEQRDELADTAVLFIFGSIGSICKYLWRRGAKSNTNDFQALEILNHFSY